MSGWITGCLCTLSSGLVVTLSVLPGKLQLRQTDSEGPTLEEHKFIVKMFIQAGNNHDWGTWIFLNPRKASWNNVRCQERTRSNKSSLQLAEELEVCQWIYMVGWMDIDGAMGGESAVAGNWRPASSTVFFMNDFILPSRPAECGLGCWCWLVGDDGVERNPATVA